MKLIVRKADIPKPAMNTFVRTVICKQCGGLVQEDRPCQECEQVERLERIEVER
jgi:hypothetical protein